MPGVLLVYPMLKPLILTRDVMRAARAAAIEDGGLRRATWSPAAGCLALRITSLLHTGRVLERE